MFADAVFATLSRHLITESPLPEVNLLFPQPPSQRISLWIASTGVNAPLKAMF
jgi:hypothetical protein